MGKYFYRIIFALSLILLKVNFIWSLECIYCPKYSTEDECNQMNVTQICVNETECGYARFIEKREEKQHLREYNESENNTLTITVKKGCMEEDYCTKVHQSERGLHVNFSQCIFCDDDLCVLEYPLLCMECNEDNDEYCAIPTTRVVTCGPQQVCYEQRDRSTYKLRRGCIEPSKCLKKNLCHHCNTDLCRPDVRLLPPQWNQNKNEEKHKYDNFYGNTSRALRVKNVVNVIYSIFLIFFNNLERIKSIYN